MFFNSPGRPPSCHRYPYCRHEIRRPLTYKIVQSRLNICYHFDFISVIDQLRDHFVRTIRLNLIQVSASETCVSKTDTVAGSFARGQLLCHIHGCRAFLHPGAILYFTRRPESRIVIYGDQQVKAVNPGNPLIRAFHIFHVVPVNAFFAPTCHNGEVLADYHIAHAERRFGFSQLRVMRKNHCSEQRAHTSIPEFHPVH